MSKIKTVFAIVVAFLVVGALWYALSPLFMNTIADDPLPTTGGERVDAPLAMLPSEEKLTIAEEATPVPIVPTTAHPASGTARVITDGNDRYLRYENYKTINGPDLRVYLATDTQATDFVDLGPLKATEGNVNYLIPAHTNLSQYRYALTWCEDFSVLFNSAELPH